MISVVIPLYNKSLVVLKTLKSVLMQTFKDYEVVIINDGSTDGSEEIVRNYLSTISLEMSEKVRIITQSNAGVSAARNRGIEESKGDVIAFIDADDEWAPQYLQTISDLMEFYPQCDVFATAYNYVEATKTYKAPIKGFSFEGDHGILDNYFQILLMGRPPIHSSSVAIRKEAIKSIGGFPTMIKSGEDLITWARLAVNFKIAYSKKALSYFTRLDDNYSTGAAVARKYILPKDDIGAKIINDMIASTPHENKQLIKGLKGFRFLWHKIRFVECVNNGAKWYALVEWSKMLPYALINLDCYYRLFLNLFPMKIRNWIMSCVGKY